MIPVRELYGFPTSGGWVLPRNFIPPEIVARILRHQIRLTVAARFNRISLSLRTHVDWRLNILESRGGFYFVDDDRRTEFARHRRSTCSRHPRVPLNTSASIRVYGIEARTPNKPTSIKVARYLPEAIMFRRGEVTPFYIELECEECLDWMAVPQSTQYTPQTPLTDAVLNLGVERERANNGGDREPCMEMRRYPGEGTKLIYVGCNDYGLEGKKRCNHFRMNF